MKLRQVAQDGMRVRPVRGEVVPARCIDDRCLRTALTKMDDSRFRCVRGPQAAAADKADRRIACRPVSPRDMKPNKRHDSIPGRPCLTLMPEFLAHAIAIEREGRRTLPRTGRHDGGAQPRGSPRCSRHGALPNMHGDPVIVERAARPAESAAAQVLVIPLGRVTEVGDEDAFRPPHDAWQATLEYALKTGARDELLPPSQETSTDPEIMTLHGVRYRGGGPPGWRSTR